MGASVTVTLPDSPLPESTDARGNDIHAIAETLADIKTTLVVMAATLSRIADKLGGLHLVATHSDPTKEPVSMSKPAKLGRARPPVRDANVPSGDKDTVTITCMDNSTPPVAFPMTGAVIVATSGTPALLTTDAPIANAYGEHFLGTGSVVVAIQATFPDGTVLTLSDSVSISGAPGNLVATHSIPILGP
jgi:hypothetical protein